MSDEAYIEARFILEKGDQSGWSEQEIDDFLEEFLGFIESKDMYCGGSFGYLTPEEKECNYCEGSGKKDFISEEERCETCDGSGRKVEEEPTPDPEAEQEWKDIYAPIAQRTEQSPPKGKAEGSNPSRSANVRNGCDRESDGEPGDQGGRGDNRGDRERSEDPGRDHSSEDG